MYYVTSQDWSHPWTFSHLFCNHYCIGILSHVKLDIPVKWMEFCFVTTTKKQNKTNRNKHLKRLASAWTNRFGSCPCIFFRMFFQICSIFSSTNRLDSQLSLLWYTSSQHDVATTMFHRWDVVFMMMRSYFPNRRSGLHYFSKFIVVLLWPHQLIRHLPLARRLTGSISAFFQQLSSCHFSICITFSPGWAVDFFFSIRLDRSVCLQLCFTLSLFTSSSIVDWTDRWDIQSSLRNLWDLRSFIK